MHKENQAIFTFWAITFAFISFVFSLFVWIGSFVCTLLKTYCVKPTSNCSVIANNFIRTFNCFEATTATIQFLDLSIFLIFTVALSVYPNVSSFRDEPVLSCTVKTCIHERIEIIDNEIKNKPRLVVPVKWVLYK